MKKKHSAVKSATWVSQRLDAVRLRFVLDAHAGAKRTTKSPRGVAAAYHACTTWRPDPFLEHGPPWR